MSKKQQKLLQKIREFRLLDDDFMSKVFEDDIECTEFILRIILDKPDLKVEEVRIYHVERVVKETEELFGDEAHIIYVNGAYRGDTPLGLLMHDFSCADPEAMHYKLLADKTRYYKKDERGVESMCKIVEELIEDEKREIAMRMLKDGKLQKEEIATYAGLTLEQVEGLLKRRDM